MAPPLRAHTNKGVIGGEGAKLGSDGLWEHRVFSMVPYIG